MYRLPSKVMLVEGDWHAKGCIRVTQQVTSHQRDVSSMISWEVFMASVIIGVQTVVLSRGTLYLESS